MARMIRKQIVLDPEQERALAEHALARGVSQSQLIREAIDALLVEADARERRMKAWEETLKASERAALDGVGSRGQKWTREELHERGSSR